MIVALCGKKELSCVASRVVLVALIILAIPDLRPAQAYIDPHLPSATPNSYHHHHHLHRYRSAFYADTLEPAQVPSLAAHPRAFNQDHDSAARPLTAYTSSPPLASALDLPHPITTEQLPKPSTSLRRYQARSSPFSHSLHIILITLTIPIASVSSFRSIWPASAGIVLRKSASSGVKITHS